MIKTGKSKDSHNEFEKITTYQPTSQFVLVLLWQHCLSVRSQFNPSTWRLKITEDKTFLCDKTFSRILITTRMFSPDAKLQVELLFQRDTQKPTLLNDPILSSAFPSICDLTYIKVQIKT